MSTKFILRFDDVTPQMTWSNFLPLKMFVEDFGIKSILGVVPDSLDDALSKEPKVEKFYELVRTWSAYGDAIAQHGTNHVYDSTSSGILEINSKSEFAGHSFSKQFNKLQKGKEILVNESVWQPWFMPPAHSFDKVTIKVLKALDFLAVTDGYGFYPYVCDSILFIPQLTSFPLKIGFGVCTICLHINTMTSYDISQIKKFILHNHNKFVDFKDVVASGSVDHKVAILLREISKYLLKSYRKSKFK